MNPRTRVARFGATTPAHPAPGSGRGTGPFPPLPGLAIVCAILCVSTSRTPAAEGGGQKYEVNFKLKEGQRWDFDLKTRMEMAQRMTADGQPQQPVVSGTSSNRKGTLEVLSVKDGAPSALRVTFDKDSANAAVNNGQNVSNPFPLAGKTVTIKRDEAGEVVQDAGDLDAATTQELKQLLEADRSTYPRHPVAVGDEWDADTRKLAWQFQLGPDDHVSVKCKLLKIGSVGGRKTADISAAGSVRKSAPGTAMTLNLGGVSQVDLATGEPLQTDMIGKITTKGVAQANTPDGPVPVQITGDGKIEIHQTIAPAAEGAKNPLGPPEQPKPQNPLDTRSDRGASGSSEPKTAG